MLKHASPRPQYTVLFEWKQVAFCLNHYVQGVEMTRVRSVIKGLSESEPNCI